MKVKLIISDDSFQRACENLIKGARKIKDPTTPKHELAELQKKYEDLAAMIDSYRVRDYLKQCPSQIPLYIKMGIITKEELEW